MRFSGAAAALTVAALNGVTRAQGCDEVVPGQYTGTPVENTLPVTHANSELNYFKIRDPSGEHTCTDDADSDFTLINYSSLNSTKGRLPNNDIQRVVIVCHGLRRDPQNYHAGMLQALDLVDDVNIGFDNVLVIAPYFPNGNDKTYGFPWNPDGTTVKDRAYSPALVWSSSFWSGGSMNQYPPGRMTVSTFDVLDQIVQYYGDLETFPNIKQIVVSGHSLGAQLVQRYAAVGKTAAQLGVQVPISYWVGDPNSILWLDDQRPFSTGKCPDIFNDYREGLANYEDYGAESSAPITYNTELVNAGSAAVLENFQSKAIHWGRALRDHGDNTGDCSPYTTGQDRNERFFNFIKQFPASCEDPAGDNCDTVDLVDSSHDAPTMFRAAAGQARLFKDNWNGDGSRAYDFGYPRHAAYDNPYPDPAHASDPLLNDDTTTYAGTMTYQGCFSDVDQAQSVGSLPMRAYVGALNTRAYCSQQCKDRGYSIAGVSDQYCYCGNQLGSQTVPVVESSCQGTCPGNTAQLCGGANRLSVMSSQDLSGQGDGAEDQGSLRELLGTAARLVTSIRV